MDLSLKKPAAQRSTFAHRKPAPSLPLGSKTENPASQHTRVWFWLTKGSTLYLSTSSYNFLPCGASLPVLSNAPVTYVETQEYDCSEGRRHQEDSVLILSTSHQWCGLVKATRSLCLVWKWKRLRSYSTVWSTGKSVNTQKASGLIPSRQWAVHASCRCYGSVV